MFTRGTRFLLGVPLLYYTSERGLLASFVMYSNFATYLQKVITIQFVPGLFHLTFFTRTFSLFGIDFNDRNDWIEFGNAVCHEFAQTRSSFKTSKYKLYNHEITEVICFVHLFLNFNHQEFGNYLLDLSRDGEGDVPSRYVWNKIELTLSASHFPSTPPPPAQYTCLHYFISHAVTHPLPSEHCRLQPPPLQMPSPRS